MGVACAWRIWPAVCQLDISDLTDSNYTSISSLPRFHQFRGTIIWVVDYKCHSGLGMDLSISECSTISSNQDTLPCSQWYMLILTSKYNCLHVTVPQRSFTTEKDDQWQWILKTVLSLAIQLFCYEISEHILLYGPRLRSG